MDDLLSLGLGGVLDLLLKGLHELSGDCLGSLGDGWPGGIRVGGSVHEGTKLFEVNACCQDGFSEGVEKGCHGGGLNEHGLDLDSLGEQSEVVVCPEVVE